MSDKKYRVVDLPSMTVASALGFGKEPENLAWGMITDWASMTGITDLNSRRYFGFNNPDPTTGSPNYGYEQWVTVEPGTRGGGNVEIKKFEGGRFVVMDCTGFPSPEKWAALVQHVENSSYHFKQGPCLEECLTPSFLFDPSSMPDNPETALHFLLYIPIE